MFFIFCLHVLSGVEGLRIHSETRNRIRTFHRNAKFMELVNVSHFQCNEENRASCRKNGKSQNDCTRRHQRCDCSLFRNNLNGPTFHAVKSGTYSSFLHGCIILLFRTYILTATVSGMQFCMAQLLQQNVMVNL